MSPESVISMGRHAIQITLMIAAPMLLTAADYWSGSQYFSGSNTN